VRTALEHLGISQALGERSAAVAEALRAGAEGDGLTLQGFGEVVGQALAACGVDASAAVRRLQGVTRRVAKISMLAARARMAPRTTSLAQPPTLPTPVPPPAPTEVGTPACTEPAPSYTEAPSHTEAPSASQPVTTQPVNVSASEGLSESAARQPDGELDALVDGDGRTAPQHGQGDGDVCA
jgi:hypothetical protein